MDDKRIQEIKARHEVITSGTWEWAALDDEIYALVVESETEYKFVVDSDGRGELTVTSADADFIAAAPDDVRDLLADNNALRAENARLREQLAAANGGAWERDGGEWKRVVVNAGFQDGD